MSHIRHAQRLALLLAACAPAMLFAQDRSPLAGYHVWLPMTGVTPEQMDEAVAAGYNAVLFKLRPSLNADRTAIAVEPHAGAITQARARGLKLVLAILGWHGLPPDRFWDTREDGTRIPGRLDPFWPEAMQAFERYCSAVIDRHASEPDVVAFAPTWGIYGEAGFTSFGAGRSPHALARFNEWLGRRNLPRVDRLPTRAGGPNTDCSRFIRFRYLYIEEQFDSMFRRLKTRARGRPVGTWQELYPVIGYLWNMVRVPSADFALYESCFPFQTSHDPQRTLAEAMGFRYRCSSAGELRDYLLPLLARKRGEGQRFMGCQLTDDYAVKHYGWTPEKARQAAFQRWEDAFGPHLQKLMAERLESPRRDVLLVFPTYAAAALTDRACHSVDAMLLDVLLRMYGCQMVRIGSSRLDQLSVRELSVYRLIVVPASAYLLPKTLERLNQTTATVLFTGCFGQSFDGQWVAFGDSRSIGGLHLRYFLRPAGRVELRDNQPLTRGIQAVLEAAPVHLPEDESFNFAPPTGGLRVLLSVGRDQLMSLGRNGKTIFMHGQLFAGLCYDPGRKPPANLSGSRDASANEVDLWGPYSSSNPQNGFGVALMKNILDHAGVAYRIGDPEPRTCAPYLGDHLEVAGISANLAYNNTAEVRTLDVRLPFAPAAHPSRPEGGRFETRLVLPPFSYVAVLPRKNTTAPE